MQYVYSMLTLIILSALRHCAVVHKKYATYMALLYFHAMMMIYRALKSHHLRLIVSDYNIST